MNLRKEKIQYKTGEQTRYRNLDNGQFISKETYRSWRRERKYEAFQREYERYVEAHPETAKVDRLISDFLGRAPKGKQRPTLIRYHAKRVKRRGHYYVVIRNPDGTFAKGSFNRWHPPKRKRRAD